MPGVSNVSSSPAGMALLRAAFTPRALPRLGEGLNLFDAPPQAAGNSRLKLDTQGANISVRA